MNKLHKLAEACGVTSFTEDKNLQHFAEMIVKHSAEIADYMEYNDIENIGIAIEEYFRT